MFGSPRLREGLENLEGVVEEVEKRGEEVGIGAKSKRVDSE